MTQLDCTLVETWHYDTSEDAIFMVQGQSRFVMGLYFSNSNNYSKLVHMVSKKHILVSCNSIQNGDTHENK